MERPVWNGAHALIPYWDSPFFFEAVHEHKQHVLEVLKYLWNEQQQQQHVEGPIERQRRREERRSRLEELESLEGISMEREDEFSCFCWCEFCAPKHDTDICSSEQPHEAKGTVAMTPQDEQKDRPTPTDAPTDTHLPIPPPRHIPPPKHLLNHIKCQNGTVLHEIRCFISRDQVLKINHIENIDDVMAPVTKSNGKASTRRTNQPAIVYQDGFYVLQHLNSTHASYFIEFEDSDSDASEQRMVSMARIVRAAEAETAMAVAASAAASSISSSSSSNQQVQAGGAELFGIAQTRGDSGQQRQQQQRQQRQQQQQQQQRPMQVVIGCQ